MTVSANPALRRITVLTALLSTSFLTPAPAVESNAVENETGTDVAEEIAPASIISSADIDDSIARQIAIQERQREDVTRLLQHPEVARIATSAGVDLERARNKAATLSGSELEALAARAAHAQSELAGGDTIVISATAIIIVLLILILLTD